MKKWMSALLALVLTCGIVVAITGVAAPTSQEDALFSEGLITPKEELTFPQTNNVTFEPGA